MPFKGATPVEICGAFLHQQPKPPSQVIRHFVMQGGPIEVKSAFAEDFHSPSVRNFSALERRVDSIGLPRDTRQELRNSDRLRTLWSLVAFLYPR
jgi:hypothetical protein